MLKQLTWLRIKPLVLGMDWQVDNLRMVLLGPASKGNHQTAPKLLGQWHWSWPLLSANGPVEAQPPWQDFIAQVAGLRAKAPVHVNVGIPNHLCTWLHCPAGLFEGRAKGVALQLGYQRMAAKALNIEPANLRVCYLQLGPNLSFLVVTKRHYSDHIGQLIMSLHDAVKGSVVGRIEPQGLTQFVAPAGIDAACAMAWFMAHKVRLPAC